MKDNFLFVISGPSGVGKTTIANEVLHNFKPDALSRVVTCTTRPPRKDEEDGVHYHFLTMLDFLAQEREKKFVETSNVYGQMYGVKLELVEKQLRKKTNLLLVLNGEGFLKIKNTITGNNKVIGFFISPPSMTELEKRIRLRATEAESIIQNRLAQANKDMAYSRHFDFVIENKELEVAIDAVTSKIREILNEASLNE